MKVTIEFDTHLLEDKAILEQLFRRDKVAGMDDVYMVRPKKRLTTLTPLNYQDFAGRTQQCFKSLGIKYIEELEYLSESDLLREPNFGRKSLNETKDRLLQKGLKVGSKGGYTYNDPKYADIPWMQRMDAYIKDIQTKLENEFKEQK